MKLRLFHPLLLAAILAFGVACRDEPPPVQGNETADTLATEDGVRYRVETFVEGLEVPWSIAFAPEGRIFFTERPGRVRLIGSL
jgi:glucose/arabinose dehydrogenase